MDLTITPGSPVTGRSEVPGDKSIAHRWLMFAATAEGTSHLANLPLSLDIRSTARVMASLAPMARPVLEVWSSNDPATIEGGGSTWNGWDREAADATIEVEGEGRAGLRPPGSPLPCGNSGTTMRLLAGLVAPAPFESVLVGDASLSSRPMERVAVPLRSMGARVSTASGHAPLTVAGGPLRGIEHATAPPSAQVKSAVLIAGLAAQGPTTVTESAPTRDHTERLLAALGAPLRREEGLVTVEAFQHGPIRGRVPGDPSSAAFIVGAAAVTGAGVTVGRVGLNPTRLGYLEVMRRMGVDVTAEVLGEEMGEPYGEIVVTEGTELRGTTIEPTELPLVIDEVPVLAALATHARGETSFAEAAELRTKESDRLTGMAEGLRGLGGHAADDGDDLVIGGGGLAGGRAAARGDHRLAMALIVAALAADAPSRLDGADAAAVSFPAFVPTLVDLGAGIEAV